MVNYEYSNALVEKLAQHQVQQNHLTLPFISVSHRSARSGDHSGRTGARAGCHYITPIST